MDLEVSLESILDKFIKMETCQTGCDEAAGIYRKYQCYSSCNNNPLYSIYVWGKVRDKHFPLKMAPRCVMIWHNY